MGFTLERWNLTEAQHIRRSRIYQQWDNPRSPRYRRTRSTKRQQRVHARTVRECLCPRSLQIGGGQCGRCGRFTHRDDCVNRRGWFAPPAIADPP